MMKVFFAACCVAVAPVTTISAQYYHKDIVSVKMANDETQILKEQKIRTVLVHSFEADGTPSEGFYCEKKFNRNYHEMETYTRSPGTAKSLLVSEYNDKGQLVKSADSSEITASTSFYSYDDNDRITSIVSYTHSSDDDFSTSLKEEHQYSYNENGKPVKMLRIKNDSDTTQVDFLLDEHGNVTDEIEPGVNGKHYYYYYDDKNRLTDIVKYNAVKGGLKADFIFEYNSAGQLSQMISVEDGVSGDYLLWRYTYNEGLRIIEKCYSKQKKLLGYFEYEYN